MRALSQLHLRTSASIRFLLHKNDAPNLRPGLPLPIKNLGVEERLARFSHCIRMPEVRLK